MNRSVLTIPGPEIINWWGVHVPLLSLVFGVVGILVGHWVGYALGAPLPMHQRIGVIVAGILLSLTITMTIGQRPLLGFSWSFGIGFSGIVIFQTMGAQARAGMRIIGELVLARVRRTKDGSDSKGESA